MQPTVSVTVDPNFMDKTVSVEHTMTVDPNLTADKNVNSNKTDSPNALESNTGTLQGRKVKYGRFSCAGALFIIVMGSVMWGVCDNPTVQGCSEIIKITGQVVAVTGITLSALNIIVFSCYVKLFGCAEFLEFI